MMIGIIETTPIAYEMKINIIAKRNCKGSLLDLLLKYWGNVFNSMFS